MNPGSKAWISLALYAGLSQAGEQVYIVPADPALLDGRKVWLGTCENCHGYGTADAPIPMNPSEWRDRVTRDRGLLYSRAIAGYIGPDYSMMPARGGNDALSDNEVRVAVDYMLFLANYYIEQESQYIKQD